MPGRIFVNYRRDDSAAHALSIAQSLERAFGANNVFLDIDRMRAGQEFPTVLKERLAECKVLIAVIGRSWLTLTDADGRRRLDDPDDWVRLEIAQALTRGIAVIPVLVGGAELPKRADLPDDLKPLLQRHVATLTTNGFRNEMAGLIRDIRAIPGSSLPWGKIGAGAVALGLAAYVGAHALGAPEWWPLAGETTVSATVEKTVLAVGVKPTAQTTSPTAGPQVASDDVRRKLEAAAERQIATETDPRRLKYVADGVPALKDKALQRIAALEAETKRKEGGPLRDTVESLVPGSGKWAKDCSACPEMVVVPAGSFTMGSPASEVGHLTSEAPQHTVTIAKPFAVGRFAVTFDEWDACVADGSCNGYKPDDHGWGRGRRPVINVSSEDAKTFLDWLSRKTGKPHRLLSESEREYVTRAGTTTAYWWGNTISTDKANYDGTFSRT